MIRSRADYRYYLEADREALRVDEVRLPKRLLSEVNEIWKFQKALRRFEYALNCKRGKWWRPYLWYLQWRHKRLGIRLGFSIPPNVFGPGLSIAHPGTLIVNAHVRVGRNCRIHNCVHLATQAGVDNACPRIGDNVFIAPGVVIVGNIEIADDIAVGANAFVNRSFTDPGITIAGIPARQVADTGSERLYHRSTERVDARKIVRLEILFRKSKLSWDRADPNLRLVVKNRSKRTWTQDLRLRIGTSSDRDRPSPLYHPSWISCNRICSFSEERVVPGKTATFAFVVNPQATARKEAFELVMEGVCWLPDSRFTIRRRGQSFRPPPQKDS